MASNPSSEQLVLQRAKPLEQEEEPSPIVGQRILVLSQEWLEQILIGNITLLVRGQVCRSSFVWLAAKDSKIYGHATLSPGFTMTEEEFAEKRHQHGWPEDEEPPYTHWCGLPLTQVHRLKSPYAYWHSASAKGWHVYRAKEEDLTARGAKRSRVPSPERAPAPSLSLGDQVAGEVKSQPSLCGPLLPIEEVQNAEETEGGGTEMVNHEGTS